MKISGLLDLNYNSTKRITDKIQAALRNQDEFLLNLIQSFDALHLTIKKEKHAQTRTKPTSSQNIPDGGSQILSSTSRKTGVPSHKPAAEMGVTIPGYDLEELLCTGSNNLCYRGRSIEDHAPVFIKVALLKDLESAHISFFHREYEMLQDLDIEGVVKPHRYHRYGDMEVLVYDDKVGLPLRSLIKNEPITLTTFLDIALSLTRTMGIVHQQNVIHKNINPENILIDLDGGTIQLIGFGIASFLPREEQMVISPKIIEARLEYISPEQSGRMNRGLDYRTDFYSLGATFYEMLSGSPPFQADDPLELVHSHMAKTPPLLSEIDPALPEMVCQIVMKLLAKTAEERYQSHRGLLADWEECQQQLLSNGQIEHFKIGYHDFSEKLQIAQGLYGRENENELLLHAFQRVAEGRCETVMVSGNPGIGKTSLVRELHKSITEKSGFFISGKFDQLQKNIPYGAIIASFKTLLQELRAESESKLSEWRTKLNEALEKNGQVMIDLIPELEEIIGPQPSVPALEPRESKNRLNLVFKNFIQTFCKQEHPLVIFLDDLQWVDLATLDLVRLIVTDDDMQYLLLIGAFRDNEVDHLHPLTSTLNYLEEERADITGIVLNPSHKEGVEQLIIDTLRTERKAVEQLATLVYQKTNGNPFFINQFLTMLYSKNHLVFQSATKSWQWDLTQIQQLDITDNVVDLLIDRLRNLSAETQHLVSMAASIGNRVDIKTLQIITKSGTADILKNLLPALEEGLIIALSHSQTPGTDNREQLRERMDEFQFLHDRVQQAAYALIDDAEKEKTHLQIGRLLLKHSHAAKTDGIFDVVGHLNTAEKIIRNRSERHEIAELNLMAGEYAKAASAFEVAFDYFKAGIDFLGESCWQNQYNLAFRLHNEAVESACFAGQYENMDNLCETVKANVRTELEKADVYRWQNLALMAQSRLQESVDNGLEFLSLVGESLPRDLSLSDVKKIILDIESMIANKSDQDLLNLPTMTDPRTLAICKILPDLAVADIIFGRFDLWFASILIRIKHVLRQGLAPDTPAFYTAYGSLLTLVGEDFDTAYRFGQLGMRLIDELPSKRVESRALLQFNSHIRYRKDHLRETIEPLLDSYKFGLNSGDLFWSGMAAFHYCIHNFFCGKNLSWLSKQLLIFRKAVLDINQQLVLNWFDIFQNIVSGLISDTGDITAPAIDHTHNKVAEKVFQESTNKVTQYQYYFNQMLLAYLFGNFQIAFQHTQAIRKIGISIKIGVVYLVFLFFETLTHLSVIESLPKTRKKSLIQKVEENQRELKDWADSSPTNFLHKYYLTEAERLRVQGREMDLVLDHYDRAIALALENEYDNEATLAYELAARYFVVKGKTEIAKVYARNARNSYLKWGADKKVRHLDETYPSLLFDFSHPESPHGDQSKGPGGLDWFTMMKLSQAIAREIELEKLLPTLIKIAIENVGAQNGWLILDSDKGLQVVAGGSTDQTEMSLKTPISLNRNTLVSESIINYVIRTRQNLVVDNAAREERFKKDDYIRSKKPKSVLCAPIFHKNALMGVLYLENNLMIGAFTAERLEILHMLFAQIAISLENANLYGNLKLAEEEYRGIFENALEGIYRTTADGRFTSANPAMARIFGFDSPQELRASITDIEHQLYVDPERRNQFIKLMQQQQTVSGFEVEFFRKDRSKFWALLHARPVYDENGELRFIEGFVTDITEQKNTMESLREREEYLLKENIRLRSNIKERYRFGDIIGKSPVMQKIYELILKAAATDASVVVYGESGTGKELVAKAIHDLSDRKEKKFVSVNCKAIPEGLLESEFFGYKKGAFTGATDDKQGFLQIAEGGTLFLDELGELDLNMQTKLLRAIEGGGYTPVGGTELNQPNVRIVAAANRDLIDFVTLGVMREDFFYRIHILAISLPPLRKRKEDIPMLVEHFVRNEPSIEDKPPITTPLMDRLLSYDWPGNVRELQNTLYRYLTFKKLDFLGGGLRNSRTTPKSSPDDEPAGNRTSLQEMERDHIAHLLAQNQWNRTRVAALLGISRYTLFRKIKKYDLQVAKM